MGNKEKILEYLKEHKEGAGAIDLDNTIDCGKYIDKDNKEKRMIYIYLARLIKDGLIEPFIIKVEHLENKYSKSYRVTEKAWEEERKENALAILEKMIPEFKKHKVNLKTTTPEEDKILKEMVEKDAV